MVSNPTFDPNLLASHDLGDVQDEAERLEDDPATPLINRAIGTTLPPGSTFKLVTAAAAIESGNYDKDSMRLRRRRVPAAAVDRRRSATGRAPTAAPTRSP